VTPDQLPVPVQQTAAEYFFAEGLENFAARLDDCWKQDIAKYWKRLRARTEYRRRNLEALSMKAQNYPLTVEEAWKRAYLTWKFEGGDAAIPLFQEVLTQDAQHPLANYQLGQILLENNSDRGLEPLKIAMEKDPSLVAPGCELLYGFYKKLGQREKAQAYLQRWQQHSEMWEKAQQERSCIGENPRFEPHNLPEWEVKQIAEQLSGLLEVREAYLVCKRVNLFPDKPFYVLGVSRRFVKEEVMNYLSDRELRDQLKAELNFSGEVYAIVFHQDNLKLKKALRQVNGACIYRY